MAKKSSRLNSKILKLSALLVVVLIGFFVINKSFFQNRCANNCQDSLNLEVNNGETAVFNRQKIEVPRVDLAQKEPKITVLGESDLEGEKHIFVDLSTQTLSAYQGETLFMETKVSTGRWGKTPTGEFAIWEKLKATKMSGGSGADYYYLPNVPYVMFFSGSGVGAGRGFSLHGAYWHNNFGHAMSHGCVNMRIIDAQKLFYWVNPDAKGKNIMLSSEDNPGTKITIYGQTPD